MPQGVLREDAAMMPELVRPAADRVAEPDAGQEAAEPEAAEPEAVDLPGHDFMAEWGELLGDSSSGASFDEEDDWESVLTSFGKGGGSSGIGITPEDKDFYEMSKIFHRIVENPKLREMYSPWSDTRLAVRTNTDMEGLPPPIPPSLQGLFKAIYIKPEYQSLPKGSGPYGLYGINILGWAYFDNLFEKIMTLRQLFHDKEKVAAPPKAKRALAYILAKIDHFMDIHRGDARTVMPAPKPFLNLSPIGAFKKLLDESSGYMRRNHRGDETQWSKEDGRLSWKYILQAYDTGKKMRLEREGATRNVMKGRVEDWKKIVMDTGEAAMQNVTAGIQKEKNGVGDYIGAIQFYINAITLYEKATTMCSTGKMMSMMPEEDKQMLEKYRSECQTHVEFLRQRVIQLSEALAPRGDTGGAAGPAGPAGPAASPASPASPADPADPPARPARPAGRPVRSSSCFNCGSRPGAQGQVGGKKRRTKKRTKGRTKRRTKKRMRTKKRRTKRRN